MLGKNFSKGHFKIFFLLFHTTGFDMFLKLSVSYGGGLCEISGKKKNKVEFVVC